MGAGVNVQICCYLDCSQLTNNRHIIAGENEVKTSALRPLGYRSHRVAAIARGRSAVASGEVLRQVVALLLFDYSVAFVVCLLINSDQASISQLKPRTGHDPSRAKGVVPC